MSGNMPMGCTENDPYFDMPSVHDEVEEAEYPCQQFTDLGIRCEKPITCVAREPYTPAASEAECCDECVGHFVSFGYSVNRYCPGLEQTCDTLIPVKDQLCTRCQQEAKQGGYQ